MSNELQATQGRLAELCGQLLDEAARYEKPAIVNRFVDFGHFGR